MFGTLTGPDDARSSGPRHTSTPVGESESGRCGGTVDAIAGVIAAVLERSPQTDRLGVVGAAQTIVPAVRALDRLADRLAHDTACGPGSTGDAGLAGFVHRRCRIGPADTEASGARGSGRLAARAGDAPRHTRRGGWELIRSTVLVPDAGAAWPDGALVTHDLARRTTPSTPLAPAPGGRGPAMSQGAIRELAVTAVDLSAWARATGDRNPIHLHPGAALRAGMRVGEGDVVVHGLLLGALSLALIPPVGAVDLRFTGAAPLPAGGAVTLRVHSNGCIGVGARTVLVRR